jgi:hypothetical protein
MSNPNWARWIIASAVKHFQSAATVFGIPMQIEGQTVVNVPTSEHIEFRMAGPHVREVSKDNWRIDCVINILYSAFLGNDIYRAQRIAGMIADAMTDICVYRYGDGADDDNTLLGTLTLLQDPIHPIRTNPFGQIAPDVKITQGTVEGSFRMFL